MMRDRLHAISRTLSRHLLEVAPLLTAAVCLVATIHALYTLTFAILGRDQGIFQYVAWAMRHGERTYRDFHEINGPLPHAWHMLLQRFGGEDEHVFRTLDTLFLVLMYALASLTLPEWVGSRVPRAASATRAAWALAGIGALGAQYATYDWWHTSQREGFYSVLTFASLAFQAMAHAARRPQRALVWFFLTGIATSLTWFGKPPCVVFTFLQIAVLVLDRASVTLPLRRALSAAIAGALLVTAGMLAFELVYGDVLQGIHVLSTVPLLHHTIWNKSLVDSYHAYGNAPRLDWAMGTTGAFVIAYFWLRLPRRTLLALVLPVGGFAVFALQGKGFPYHLHMLTLGTAVTQLVLLAALARRAEHRTKLAWVVAVGAVALGFKCRDDAHLSQSEKSDWSEVGATPAARTTRAYLERFPWGDFFPADMRDAAAFVRERTRPDDRVQTYGLDPYFLFLARRQSASPVIYDFELNVDAALEGGSGAMPTEATRAALRAHRDAAANRDSRGDAGDRDRAGCRHRSVGHHSGG